jgi:peptidoglycan hydrolase-like protein with peptidoglycan-binding domain
VTGGGGGSSGQQTTTTTTTEAKTTETTTTEKPIAQMNTTELRAKIAQIQAQIQVLLGELAKLGVSATTVAKVQFKATLKTGQTSDEVKAMQQCLAKDKDVYPQGIASGYFGSLTKQALIKFQEKYGTEILAPYGLTKGTGIVGSATRQKLNEICK